MKYWYISYPTTLISLQHLLKTRLKNIYTWRHRPTISFFCKNSRRQYLQLWVCVMKSMIWIRRPAKAPGPPRSTVGLSREMFPGAGLYVVGRGSGVGSGGGRHAAWAMGPCVHVCVLALAWWNREFPPVVCLQPPVRSSVELDSHRWLIPHLQHNNNNNGDNKFNFLFWHLQSTTCASS